MRALREVGIELLYNRITFMLIQEEMHTFRASVSSEITESTLSTDNISTKSRSGSSVPIVVI